MNSKIMYSFLVALLFVSCQESKEDTKQPISQKDLYKAIGEEIPFETGMEWISFYKQKQGGLSRLQSDSGYHVSSEKINVLLESIPDPTGIAFHYGLDERQELHILAIPVDEGLHLWSTQPKIIVDANTGVEISQELALSWAESYKNNNPDAIWFHFFGNDIFDEMRALPYYDSIDIQPAINVLDLTPQLLLVVWNNDGIALGRTQYMPGAVYDASNACPPCAVK